MSSVLHRKLRREIWQMRGQVLAIALVIAGGVAVCIMSLVNYSSLLETRQNYYQNMRFADVFLEIKRAPLHEAEAARRIPGVQALESRIVAGANLELKGFREPVTARIVSLPDTGMPSVNRLHLRRGRLPDPRRQDEVMVIGSFAEAHDLGLDDHITAIINGRRQTLRIVGVAESPEFIYVIPPGSMLPDYSRYGVLWMSRSALAPAMDMEGAFNSLVLRVGRDASVDTVMSRVDTLLDRYGSQGAISREDQFSNRFLSDELKQLRTMAIIFPVIFMGVAMFLLSVVVGRLINTQRDVVAILKAFGYSNRQVGMHYGQLVLLICAIGVVIGLIGGIWLGRGMGAMYMDYYRFPELLFRLHPAWVVAVVVISLAAALAGAWRAIRSAVDLPPAEAMRPEAPKKYRATLIERVVGTRWFSAPGRMILRQLERRPVRSLLSILGIGMATAIVLVGNFQFDSVNLMVHTQFARVQQQDVMVTFTEPQERSALYTLARDEDVTFVEGRRSLLVRLRHGHRSWRTGLSGIPDGARLQYVISADQQPVGMPREGLLLTDFLAERLDVGPGDVIQVEVLEGRRRTIELPVTGITSEFLGVGAYMRLDRLARALGEAPLVNQALLNTDEGDMTALYKRLRERPRIAGISVRQTTLESFYETLARTFLTFTFFNSLLGGVIAFGVIYNTVRIALVERQRELASLRVLGYTRGEVGHILLGEMAVLLILAIPVGWAVGYFLALGLVTAMQTELYRVPLVVTDRSYALAATVVFGSALASGWVAWRRLKQLDLVEVLKTRD